MTASSTGTVAAIADAFGRIASTQRCLAVRPADLAGQTVLLFNNSKLDPGWGELGAIFDVVAAEIDKQFSGATVKRLTLDLLGPTSDPLGEAFAAIVAIKPAVAILALADIGVSQRTVDLALRLEEQGIACCVIAAPPGGGFSRAVVATKLPGLPVVELPVSTTSPREEIVAAATHQVDLIIAAVHRHASSAKEMPAPAYSLNIPTEVLSAVDSDTLYDALTAARLGDGLPVVAPRGERVEALLATVLRSADEVLFAGLVPSGIPITVERLAANAVMAGCRPEWFPVVLAAFEAMTTPSYRLAQAAITTHPSGNLIMVSGPLATTLGIAGGAGCLGPGHRANLTIARALNLTLINVGRIRPGEADLASFGTAGEIACCFAENQAANPWSGFNEDHYDGDTTCVMVHRTEFPHAALDTVSTRPEPILETIASVAATLGPNALYNPAELVVILNPEHARLIARCGWSKRDVREFLFAQMQIPASKVLGRGMPSNRGRTISPDEFLSVVNDADEIIVTVAGGPGPHSMVASPWGARMAHRKITQ